MTLLYPVWLTILVLGPVILLLHIRRPRRVTTSSTVIWRRVARVGDGTDGGQGGAVDWPLILQLAILVALSLALARPTLGFGAGVDHRVFVLDASYGMLAADNDARLLDRAATWLERELLDVPPAVKVTVVAAGERPQALAVRSGAAAASARLGGVVGWATGADRRAALDLVAGTLRPDERTSVTVLTTRGAQPGWVGSLEDSVLESLDVLMVEFGEARLNTGFVAAAAVRDQQGSNTVSVSGSVAASESIDGLVVVLEHGDTPLGDFRELDRLTLDLVDSTPVPFEFRVPDRTNGLLRLRLPAADTHRGDDEVLLPLPARAPRVLVVGEPGDPLARVLSLLTDVEVFVVGRLTELADDFDLVIITDRAVTGIPRTSTLWLGTVPGGAASAATVTRPEVTTWSTQDALSTGDWSGLAIQEAYAGRLLAGATALVSSGRIPLVQARLVDTGYQVVVSFSVANSNWASLASFPAFIGQVVDRVVPPARRAGSTACVVARPCQLEARLADPEIELTLPDGSRWPPRGTWVAAPDEFAKGYWILGGGELSLKPATPGTIHQAGPESGYQLPIVANSAGFASATDPSAFFAQVTTVEAGVERGRGTLGLDATGITTLLCALLVIAHAAVLWLRRVRWMRGRAPWVHLATGLVVAGLVAALLRLPLPASHRVAQPIALVDLRSETQVDVPAEVPRVVLTGVRGAASSLDSMSAEPVARVDGLEQGLELALGVAAVSGAESIVVYPLAGRGLNATEVDTVAARAVAAGVRIDLVQSSAFSSDPIDVTAVHVPLRIAVSTTVEALLTIESSVDRLAALTIEFDGETLVDADVDIFHGVNALRVPLRFGQVAEGALVISLTTSDPEIGDNVEVLVDVVAAPQALLVGPDRVATATMAKALDLQGFSVDIQPALNVPWSLEGWAAWDLLVLLDVSAHSLHSAQLDALEQWVGQRGGGLLLLGGATSFGPGGYLRTPLDDLSPLSSQVPSEAPEVTMVFVIDRSGSMQQTVGMTTRMGIAKEATVAAMELLGPGSHVAVVVYDEVAQVLTPLTPIEDMEVVARDVGEIRASGGTSLLPALIQVAEVLEGSESAAIHVVVLTDGMSQPGEFRPAIAALRDLGASISFVGIGSGTDKIQLNDLAAMAGGALHITDDVRALPSILAQEALLASQDLVHEGAFDVVRQEPPGPLARDLSRAGRVGGYVQTEVKPTADLLAWTFEEEPAPLLATWRYGLGRVIAFASHGAGRWTEDWLSGEAYPLVWGQMARWATATDVPGNAALSLSVYARTVWVTARTYGLDGSEASGRELLVAIDGEELERPAIFGLSETRPGTYEASLEVSESGEYGISIQTPQGDVLVSGQVLVNERVVSSSEFLPVMELPLLTGGQVLTEAPQRGSVDIRWNREPVVAPWLIIALMAFLTGLVVVYGVPRWSDVVIAWTSLRGDRAPT